MENKNRKRTNRKKFGMSCLNSTRFKYELPNLVFDNTKFYRELIYSLFRIAEIVDLKKFFKEYKVPTNEREIYRTIINQFKNSEYKKKLIFKMNNNLHIPVKINEYFAMGVALFEYALMTALMDKNSKEYECVNKLYFEPFRVKLEPFDYKPTENAARSIYEEKLKELNSFIEGNKDNFDNLLDELKNKNE